ncbi:MAG: hypothetical protein IKQ81_03455 [Clostridiales bacterium]|nr:hypothetical protein [Clostridiales bacterium]
MIDLSFLAEAVNTVAKLNSGKLITYGTRALAIVAGFGTVCYGIKKISDHDTMEHGYESEIKFGNFETKLRRAELDATDVYIERNNHHP